MKSSMYTSKIVSKKMKVANSKLDKTYMTVNEIDSNITVSNSFQYKQYIGILPKAQF
jgi:hypothetical protein